MDKKTERIDYKTIDYFSPGLIEELLRKCYNKLIDCFPDDKPGFYQQWNKEDNDAFNNPETIGKYVLFSFLRNNVIGYFSWDDRQYPLGLIGQNCILPDFQGQGYGNKQIEYIIKIFQDRKFKEIRTTTGNHDFFKSAQKMYVNCGFRMQRKIKGNLFELIEYSKKI